MPVAGEGGPPVKAGVPLLVEPPHDGLSRTSVAAGYDVGSEIKPVQELGIGQIPDCPNDTSSGRHPHNGLAVSVLPQVGRGESAAAESLKFLTDSVLRRLRQIQHERPVAQIEPAARLARLNVGCAERLTEWRRRVPGKDPPERPRKGPHAKAPLRSASIAAITSDRRPSRSTSRGRRWPRWAFTPWSQSGTTSGSRNPVSSDTTASSRSSSSACSGLGDSPRFQRATRLRSTWNALASAASDAKARRTEWYRAAASLPAETEARPVLLEVARFVTQQKCCASERESRTGDLRQTRPSNGATGASDVLSGRLDTTNTTGHARNRGKQIPSGQTGCWLHHLECGSCAGALK